MSYIESGDVKQVIVQLKTGATWTAEIGMDGHLRLLKKLKDPEFSEEELKEQQQAQADAQQQQGQSSPQDSHDAQPADPAEQWGDAESAEDEYSDEEWDKYIEKMQHRGSSGDASNHPRIWDKKKLTDAIRKKLKDPAFQARLSSVMLDNKYDRKLRGRTRGKLDMSRLYKAPTMARNLFTQKQRRRGKQYNIVFVVDQSGSMGGRPAQIAAESVLLLATQFDHLNINVGVVGYGDSVQVWKELKNKKFNHDELYSGLLTGMGGTNDYPALARGYQMFKHAPEGQNILIHFSDGSPGYYYPATVYDVHGKQEKAKYLPKDNQHAGGGDHNSKLGLHHLVKSYRDVDSFGIGIQAGGWQIPEHVIIQSVDELKPELLKFLRGHIRRG